MMLHQRLAAIRASSLSPTERWVLTCITSHANDDGTNCFPGPARLADETGFSPRTIKATLATLVDIKVIRRSWDGSWAHAAVTSIDWVQIENLKKPVAGSDPPALPRDPTALRSDPPALPPSDPPALPSDPAAPHPFITHPLPTRSNTPTPPPVENDPIPVTIQKPDGAVTIPGDLFQLLYGVRAGNRDAVRSLLDMGVETTAQLLELTADQRQYTKGNPGPLVWSAIQKHLQARYGIGLGALQHQPSTTGTPADWTAACTATRTKSYDGLTANIRQAIRDVGGSAAFAARNDFTEKDLRARFLARVGELNSKQERT
jgi:hypothetical protein